MVVIFGGRIYIYIYVCIRRIYAWSRWLSLYTMTRYWHSRRQQFNSERSRQREGEKSKAAVSRLEDFDLYPDVWFTLIRATFVRGSTCKEPTWSLASRLIFGWDPIGISSLIITICRNVFFCGSLSLTKPDTSSQGCLSRPRVRGRRASGLLLEAPVVSSNAFVQ